MQHLSPDGSRDLRIEDPTNLWLIHPASRRLLPLAIGAGVSANAVSVTGLVLGAGAAACYWHWHSRAAVLCGLLLSAAWLIADGLDGMVARATRTASALGRFLDGVCDHGVFALIYLVLAFSVNTAAGWALAVAAGVAHAVQSSLFEGERARFHRRSRGELAAAAVRTPANALVALYDAVAGSLDRSTRAFEDSLAAARDRTLYGAAYAERAVVPMRAMIPLSANARVLAIALACLAGNPKLFWWFELLPLTGVAVVGILWHRRVESRLVTYGATGS